jgi:hydrogenase/urease accessory protein HupE
MGWLITKYLITAGIIIAVSEVAKRNDRLGALLVALPIVTILAMLWLYVEGQPTEKIANLARYTFWYVLTTLPLFLVFPILITRFGFWTALLVGSLASIGFFLFLENILRQFNVHLMP